MNPDVALGVDNHGKGIIVIKLGDVLGTKIVLNNLEGRGGSGVVDAQSVRHLCIGCSDGEIPSDCEVGGGEVSEAIVTGRRDEVPEHGSVPPDGQVLC